MGFENFKDEIEDGTEEREEQIEVMNEVPIVNGSSLVEDRVWKIMIDGESASGKTDFALGWINYEIEDLGKKPEDVLLCIIDLDDGVTPLLQQGRVKPQHRDRVLYLPCKDFASFLRSYEQFKPVLIEHNEKTGNKGMLFVDNMHQLWEWAREKYTKDSYGMTMEKLLILRRKKAIENNTFVPTFDQISDYGIINPLHNDPLEDMKFESNRYFHYIWATPTKSEFETRKPKPGGQKDNILRVDYHLRKYTEGEDVNLRYFADLIKNRGLSRTFVHLENPTFSRFAKAIETIKEADKNVREIDLPILPNDEKDVDGEDDIGWNSTSSEKETIPKEEKEQIEVSNGITEQEEMTEDEEDIEW